MEIIGADRGNTSTLKISWKVETWTETWMDENQEDGEEMNIALSEGFQLGEQRLFRAELKLENPGKQKKPKFYVRFLSYGHDKISCITNEVACIIHQDHSIATERFQMDEEATQDAKYLQLFTIRAADLTATLSLPFTVTFHVKLCSTVPNFINKMIDSTWSEQLWAAAVNKKMTDVEFVVDEEAFGAHRSLLSARSPVFTAMFASGMKEAETGKVRIDDVDPATFRQFLKFLYTGTVELSSLNGELFTVADRYQVETLMELCRPASETDDVNDDALKTFLFC